MKFQWKKLYQYLDDVRKESGIGSWRALATRSGVTPSLFTRISQGKPTSVSNLLKLLNILTPPGDSFGPTLAIFVETKKVRTQ